MSSPWCGGGLLRGLRGGPGAGCRRGALDAKPGRPGAGRVTAPLRAALPLGDGALGFLADMPAPRMVRSRLRQLRPRMRRRRFQSGRRRPGGTQRLGRQIPTAVAQAQLARETPFNDDPRTGPGVSTWFELRPRNRWTAAPSPSASKTAHQTPIVAPRHPQPRCPRPRQHPPRPPASTPPCDPVPSRSTPFAPLPDRARPPTEHDPKEDTSTLVRPDISTLAQQSGGARPAILAVLRTAPVPCLACSDRRLPRKTTFTTKF